MRARVLVPMIAVLSCSSALSGCDGMGLDSGVGPEPSADAGGVIDSADEDGLFAGSRTAGGEMTPPDAAVADSCYGEPGQIFCDSADCGHRLRACCVGDGQCCAPVLDGPLPEGEIAVAGCTGDVATCLGDAMGFGSQRPWIAADALHPGGSAADDGGVVVGEPIDLGVHSVTLAGTFARPSSSCGAGCLEGVGMGFTTQILDELADNHVRPLAGLLYSGSRHRMSLLVADEVVGEWDLGADEERWELSLLATGELLVSAPSLPGGERAIFAPARAASLVLWGRTSNPPGGEPEVLGARLSQVGVSTVLCDQPAAWRQRRRATLTAGGLAWQPVVDRVSAAYDGEEPWMALGVQGEIFLAEGTSATELSIDSVDLPALPPDRSAMPQYAARGVFEPMLTRQDDRWVLYFTAEDGEGKRTIGRAESAPGSTDFIMSPEPLIGAVTGLEGLSQPTVAVHHTGELVMVVVGALENGGRELAILRKLPGGAWRPMDRGHLAELTRRGGGVVGSSAAGFDVDEVAYPSLVVHNGAWQLFYAGRRGSRWSVGLLVSDQLTRWRAPQEGPVLGHGGGAWERVGVLAPAAVSIVEPAGHRVELFYLGSDGVRLTPAWTDRPATDVGEPPL